MNGKMSVFMSDFYVEKFEKPGEKIKPIESHNISNFTTDSKTMHRSNQNPHCELATAIYFLVKNPY